ncbi:MAG: bifunctional 4-hydroxy-2-oxoglutarate aldolase/2-dehydro-3-deoxy-phosphogluconate aldolase [Clostridia bacterium]|nr:bifunctional 4-hydroxy-2-oxoglutarate aldolase/2-dehydro-3-deoxy-phosphogluconate aldolase [Clostridia bacterium]
MKNEVIKAIEKNKIIVILRGVPEDKLICVADALYKGGIRMLEITYSADKKVSDIDTAKQIQMLASHFNGKMFIGAGTVLNAKQVLLTKKAGGSFIISPDVNKSVIKATNKCGMVSIPGALTPSEITAAHNFGADYIKLFPVTSLGYEYVKAVKAPLSHIRFLAVGGIDENNMSDYLNAGVCGFGVGSNIAKKQFIADNDFSAITSTAQKYTEAILKG